MERERKGERQREIKMKMRKQKSQVHKNEIMPQLRQKIKEDKSIRQAQWNNLKSVREEEDEAKVQSSLV